MVNINIIKSIAVIYLITAVVWSQIVSNVLYCTNECKIKVFHSVHPFPINVIYSTPTVQVYLVNHLHNLLSCSLKKVVHNLLVFVK